MFWNESGETIPQMRWYQMSIVPYQNADPVWSSLTIFDWLHGVSRLLIDGLLRTETDHPTIHHRIEIQPGGAFKNAYELLNLRALKITMLYKNHIFQCMGNIFCVEFQRVPRIFAGHAKSSGSSTAAARIHTILDSKEPSWSVDFQGHGSWSVVLLWGFR